MAGTVLPAPGTPRPSLHFVELAVIPRLPAAMPWTRQGRPYALITGLGVPPFHLERLSLPLDDELFRRAVIAPVFVSAALAGALVAVLALLVLQKMPELSAGSEASPRGSVVVLGSDGTMRGTGAGTVIDVFGEHVRILTAKHVAVFGNLVVRFNPTTSFPAHVVDLEEGHDVAVIEAIVPLRTASELPVATAGVAREDEQVVIAGTDANGLPDRESAQVTQTRGELPDGPANGRFALSCALCHVGDSGAGVFDSTGALVGVYVGFWTYDDGDRVSVAENPMDGRKAAAIGGP